MIHRVLGIGRWVIDFLFAPKGYDIVGTLGCLYEIGATNEVMERAEDIMLEELPNRGFTFTNPELKRAVVVIGPTTSGKEFQNTLVHEVRHLADTIAKSIGYKLDAEGPAYMSGDTVMALADVICTLGCEHCNG